MWLWTPPALFLLPYVALSADRSFHEGWIRSEHGVTELATAFFLVLAIAAAARALVALRDHRPASLLPRASLWLLLGGCVFFLGEETSWGQHFFGWRSPEVFASWNDQGETNLHNLGGWTESVFDHAPRIALGGLALLLGLLPFVRREPPRGHPLAFLWSSPALVPVALLAPLASVPQKLARLWGGPPLLLEVRGGETKELLFALMLFLWLSLIGWRLRARAAAAG